MIGSQSFGLKFSPTAAQEGAVVSLFTAGAFFGAALGGPSGDYVGRRMTIIMGSVIFCLGGALQTGAETLSYLYAGRFFAGVGYVHFVVSNRAFQRY